MKNYAMQTSRKTTTPSKDNSSVGLWIIAPAIASFVFGGLMFAGGAMAYLSVGTDKDGRFIFGMAMLGAGAMGLLATAVKSWSFDRAGGIVTSTTTPVFYEPLIEKQQTIGGNGAVRQPTRDPHLVTYDGRSHNFTQVQMLHMAARYFPDGDKQPDFKITRDNAMGQKVFTEWQGVKDIMRGLDYWMVDSGGVFWTDSGGAWFEAQHREIAAPYQDTR